MAPAAALATFPSGHLGHLSVEQSKAFDDFKELCQREGYFNPASDRQKIGRDEATLLRFLRARKFVPEHALQQYKATLSWRTEQNIEKLYDTIDLEDYEQTRRQYTQWTGRRDKRGIPLYVFKIGALENKAVFAQDTSTGGLEPCNGVPVRLRRLFATYEHLTDFVMPLCSAMPDRQYPETPISQTCNIVDVSGVGLRQFWTLRNHLQDAAALANAYYPETLGVTFIGWFDPITVAKVFIVPQSKVRAVLEQHIEPQNIPKRYGGKLEWDFGQMPDLDPKILEVMKMEKGTAELPMGPILWTASEDNSLMNAHAVGTSDGAQRDECFARIDHDVFFDWLQHH